MKCLWCETTDLPKRRKKFCSDQCSSSWHYENSKEEYRCLICGVIGKRSSYDKVKTERTGFCRGCSRSFCQEGKNNHQWRGGHKYWQAGKLGRDKDGLSWKVQRRLCRERDNHTCQDCGKTKEELGYEPHCDHEIPYRLSFSHALSNLKLRCRTCHKKVEAQRTELWGGKVFGSAPKFEGVIKCKPSTLVVPNT